MIKGAICVRRDVSKGGVLLSSGMKGDGGGWVNQKRAILA